MKIVFLAPFGIRPKGTVIARMLPLAVELQALGHIVTIIMPPYTNPEDSGKVEVLQGVRLVNVKLPKGGKAWTSLVLAWSMFNTALDEKADIVHLFKPKGYGGLAAMLHITLQRMGIRLPPLFLDTDDWEGQGGMNEIQCYSKVEKKLFAFQEQWLSKRALGVTVASRALEALTAELGVASERIFYLPNCVTASSGGVGNCVREKLGIAKETPLVLLYTRFFEFSIERLSQILAGIRSRHSEVRFLVVGKGNNREEEHLLLASRKMGFNDSLIMAGWIDPSEIPDFLAAGDLALYPLDDTLVNRAKCPAKLTELLLAGVPVVADRVGQVSEYIIHEASGILCDPHVPIQMADQAVALIKEPEKLKRIGSEGKSYLLNHFNWRDAAMKLDEFYRSSIKND